MELKLKEKKDLDEFEVLERKAEKDQEVRMRKHETKLKMLFF